MARLIQDELKKPLAESILFGELSESGGDVFITADEEGIKLSVEAHEAV
jgi:ATP-dependent Clp protease ATP-binding subunit ClpA